MHVFDSNSISCIYCRKKKSRSNRVVEGPDTDDGDEAGTDKDNVQAEQQTVDDDPDH